MRRNTWLLVAFVGVVMVTVGQTALGDETTRPEPEAALVIIDIQGFYFEGGALPLVGSVEASKTAGVVLQRFRALGWPVIHVQHLPKDQSTPGQDIEPESYRVHADVAPLAGETVIGKHHANAFRDTDLHRVVCDLGVDRLVIVGMQTHMCLEAATRAAADMGFEVTVVHDACATRDLEFDGTEVPAALVHASTLASLDRSYARVVSASELLDELESTQTSH